MASRYEIERISMLIRNGVIALAFGNICLFVLEKEGMSNAPLNLSIPF